MTETEVKRRLKSIGFILTDGYENLYRFEKESKITVDLSKPNYPISYPKDLKVWDKTTSNLFKEESFVVLQCITKLLELGYPSKNIELEKFYELGTGREKGKLDIFIKDNKGNPYCLIECKTVKTFQNTWADMLKDHNPKHQLLSYYQQEKNSKILILYTYDFSQDKPEYHLIIPNQFMRVAGNLLEVIKAWDKSSSKIGFFENSPYDLNFNIERERKDLQKLTEVTGKGIYHQFATILRKYSISDKSNAFNKLFNLFLCKIIDEDKIEGILEFQWKKGDNEKDLAKRLNDLYKRGMLKFLDTQITDYSDEDFENYKNDTKLLEKIEGLRLYKNNEFSFIEVFNEESFKENMKVVIEVVKLLEPYQFRYSHKQQYLGDFFELLLNTGFKQENGQFFTPIPLAEFIVRSLPLKEMIKKNEDLPYFIDYACGSGHFLTEGMDEIQSILEKEGENLFSKSQSKQKSLQAWLSDSYSWAKEYVYGIENDYRLVKTTKVACFLNGDGEANILHANGLYRFNHPHYRGKLQKPNQFDILLANPPYSIDGFLSKLEKEDLDSFSMKEIVTPNTDDIECFFIERTSSLLKEGGIIGIVLPVTILNSSSNNLYYQSLKILIRDFDIKALVDVGSNGFMKTGTNTIIVFAQKRKASFLSRLINIINHFFLDKKDVVANGITNAFSTYVKETYEGILFKDFTDNLSHLSPSKLEREKERILDFLIAYPQVLPVIKSGSDNTTAQKFLGYKFSERRGSEGIHFVGEGKLYPKLKKELQEDKANYYIYQSFLGNLSLQTSIHSDLKDHIFITRLFNLLSWKSENDWRSLRLISQVKIVSHYNFYSLKEILKIKKGRPITREETNSKGSIPVVAGGQKYAYFHNQSNVDEAVITVSASGASAGFVSFHDYPIWASDCIILTPLIKDAVKLKFIFYTMKFLQEIIYSFQKGSAQPHVYPKDLEKLLIPLPSLKKQAQIISLMQEQEKLVQEMEKEINKVEKSIKSMDFSIYPMIKIEEICEVVRGGSPRPINDFLTNEEGLNWIKISDATSGDGKYILKTKEKIKKEGLNQTRFVKKGSLLLSNSMTFGKPFILGIDGCIHDGWLSLTIKDKNLYSKDYIYYILNSQIVSNSFEEKAKGSVVRNLNIERVCETKIPIPSLREQEKIVSDIKEQELLISRYKEKIQRAKDQQKAIMGEIFTLEKS